MYWFAEKKEPRALTRSSPLAYLERAGVLGDGGVGRGGGGGVGGHTINTYRCCMSQHDTSISSYV